jgi:plasmid maintenance system antidote protein VapI
MKKSKSASRQIVKAIAESGMSRYAIAKSSGIDQSTLSRMVNGNGWLSRDAFDRLADALGLEIIIRPKRKGR